uniref:BTB domain-containing protein n=1 Tax=Lutzomyia longipalpis TaxID=7200 RepID=A0A7G3AWU7_LUTLO
MASSGEKILKTREKWSEKFGKIDDRFSSFYNECIPTDVTFIVGPDKEIAQAHKFVLIACSWEFFIVLSLLKLDDKKLRIPDISYDAFICFLEFCYKGKVDLKTKDVWSVLKLAYRFDVKQLIETCKDFLIINLNVSTCIEFYIKDTFLPDDSELRKKIFETIETDFAAITSNENSLKSFLDLPAQKLYTIARSENLRCDEMDVFRSLMKWAEHACSQIRMPCYPKNLRKMLGNIFHEIRFPTMKMEQIFEVQAYYPELLSYSEISAIAKVILKKKKLCHGFKYTSRKGYRLIDSIENTTNTLTINESAPIADKIFYVNCFEKGPQYSNLVSKQLSVTFMSKLPRKIVGFCYYAFETRPPKLQYCSLNQKSLIDWTVTKMEMIQYNISGLPTVHCYKVYFQDKQDIIPNQWHDLYCIFEYDIPILTLQSSFKSYDEFSKIHLQSNYLNIIPILIFE